MRLPALGAAIAIFTMLSSRVNAADLALPPPAVGPPQYGVAPPPAVSPLQVIIVPGLPPAPSYDGAMLPPPVAGPLPYGLPPSAGYGAPGPQVYSGRGAPPIPDRYPEHYGLPHPQAYSGRGAPSTPERDPGPYVAPPPVFYPPPPSRPPLTRLRPPQKRDERRVETPAMKSEPPSNAAPSTPATKSGPSPSTASSRPAIKSGRHRRVRRSICPPHRSQPRRRQRRR
jgi:hypothetical protein